jgi:cellulose synthase/poly-beta-1,6-N-acetylglucosamine synthase-like glycosyltransferase
MTFYFLVLFGLYFVLLLVLRIGWSIAVAPKEREPVQKNFLISVIIPVRNEGRNVNTLLHGLANQHYPSADFEVIMVDDHSSDNAVENCRGLLQNLKVLSLGENEIGKKAALTHGINFAKGDIITTTDADCLLQPDWLTTINAVFQDQGVTMAAGMVAMADEKKFFSRWQAMEFASVIGTGMAALGLNKPLMCNGANLSFRKGVFQEVKGYEGNEQIPSGDDEFLMRKIMRRFPGSIRIANSIVTTRPQESLKDFLYQRIRWASKWKENPSVTTRLLAVFIFLMQASWIFLFLGLTRQDYRSSLVLVVVKIAADLLFFVPVFRFMKIRFRILPFLGLQFLYPFYVIFVGLLAPWSGYRWKDRKIL